MVQPQQSCMSCVVPNTVLPNFPPWTNKNDDDPMPAICKTGFKAHAHIFSYPPLVLTLWQGWIARTLG